MNWLRKIIKRQKKKRIFVLGLDGVPYSFVKNQIENGRWHNFADVVSSGSLKKMSSVLPTVSSVAWSSFMTGKNPGKHNIYGFIDRVPERMEMFIPTSKDMRGKTLWEILSDNGKKVVVMNVPLTYPPRDVNGILVSGFMATNIDKATTNASIRERLKRIGYVIDVDPWQARESKEQFLIDLNDALERRMQAAFDFMETEDWDFFMCLVMETDRINHFFWEDMESGNSTYATRFMEFYDRIDALIGELVLRLKDRDTLIILSDHGFCTLKKEIQLNKWLLDKEWLKLKRQGTKELSDIAESSFAYSLIPGRVFINLEGREATGRIKKGSEYERALDELTDSLLELTDTESSQEEKIIEKIYKREEIYHGECLENAPDLIAASINGYDLKGSLSPPKFSDKGAINGMHTFDDAFVFVRDNGIVPASLAAKDNLRIIDVMPTILQLMDVPIPNDLDGRAIVS